MIVPNVQAAVARPGARQFGKFIVVGISSTVIDYSILNLLYTILHQPLWPSISIAFLCAVTNGFIWNRRWTFKEGAQDVRTQYPKFVLTNIIGYCLNVSIMIFALWLGARWGFLQTEASVSDIFRLMLEGGRKMHDIFSPLAVNVAKLVATVCVVAWNFSASKFWTFKTTTVPNR